MIEEARGIHNNKLKNKRIAVIPPAYSVAKTQTKTQSPRLDTLRLDTLRASDIEICERQTIENISLPLNAEFHPK